MNCSAKADRCATGSLYKILQDMRYKPTIVKNYNLKNITNCFTDFNIYKFI